MTQISSHINDFGTPVCVLMCARAFVPNESRDCIVFAFKTFPFRGQVIDEQWERVFRGFMFSR